MKWLSLKCDECGMETTENYSDHWLDVELPTLNFVFSDTMELSEYAVAEKLVLCPLCSYNIAKDTLDGRVYRKKEREKVHASIDASHWD